MRSNKVAAAQTEWSPATAKGVLELFGKELGMFIDRKIIGIKRLEDMGDDELRQIAGQAKLLPLSLPTKLARHCKPCCAPLLASRPTD